MFHEAELTMLKDLIKLLVNPLNIVIFMIQ